MIPQGVLSWGWDVDRSGKCCIIPFIWLIVVVYSGKCGNIKILMYFSENNFVCDCRLKWMHVLRNETKSQGTKDSLDGVTCKMDPPIVSSAYNKMPESNDKMDYNQDILHAGITIETLNEKMNITEKKTIPEQELADVNTNDIATKKLKRNVLKIDPETLPCPRDRKKTTEAPPIALGDPLIPIQNEMKTFGFHGMSSGQGVSRFSVVVLWNVCLAFFFT